MSEISIAGEMMYEIPNGGKFFKVPVALVECEKKIVDINSKAERKLNMRELIVLSCLCNMGACKRNILFNQADVAKKCNMSRITFVRTLNSLRENNVVLVEKENNYNMRYKLNQEFFK